MSKLETPSPETKETDIHSREHIILYLPNSIPVAQDTIPAVLETIPVVPNSIPLLPNSTQDLSNSMPVLLNSTQVLPNSIPFLPNTIPVVHNTNPAVSNTNSVTDTRTLDQKASTVICKICHSGGSYEQLIQPCFCKGNEISIF